MSQGSIKGYSLLRDRMSIIQAIALTVVLELITVVLRFGAKLESTRDTASTIGRLTLGLRIHHGYCGAAIMLVAYGLADMHPRVSRWLWIIGIGLFASDMIHHFLVLWPVTGSPQFDFWYK